MTTIMAAPLVWKNKKALKPSGSQGFTVLLLDALAIGHVPEIPFARAKKPVPLQWVHDPRTVVMWGLGVSQATAVQELVGSCGHHRW